MPLVTLSGAPPSDVSLRVVHTSQLEPDTTSAVRELLDVAFERLFTEDDWQHALGGLHVLAERDGEVLGHVALVQRSFVCDERPLRVGYVEGLAVHPRERRRGVASSLMERAEALLIRAFELGALSATELSASLYDQRGWLLWRGPLGTFSPDGALATPDESGGIYVFPVRFEPVLSGRLLADYRSGDVW